jgi:hypothetical protein
MATLRLLASGLFLYDLPVLYEQTVFQPEYVHHNPIGHAVAASEEPAMKDY